MSIGNKKIKSIEDLAMRHNYLSEEINFVFGKKIWEYDIKQANINALRATGRIAQNEYDYLANCIKLDREIYIGNKIKSDPSIQKSIYEGIDTAKLGFLTSNNISIDSVMRVANDALYVLSPISQQNTVINVNGFPMTFVLKNVFTTYMKLNNQILFFFSNGSNEYNVDIKGISDDILQLHQPLFLSYALYLNIMTMLVKHPH